MKIKKGDIVCCTWDDACSAVEHWIPVPAASQIQTLATTTVGIVLAHTKKRIVIASTINANRDAACVMVIPTGMVINLEKLTVK